MNYRNFVSAPARGPPMATKPAGFNPFPQQQQMVNYSALLFIIFSFFQTENVISSS